MDKYVNATVQFFGSGTVEVRMLEVSIILRLPWVRRCVTQGRMVDPKLSREGLMALRKITPSERPIQAPGAGLADAAVFPHLVEYLTATTYPDGSARQASSVVIVADSGGWRGCVSDKDNERTLWRTSTTAEGLLLELEEALATDDPTAWRHQSKEWKKKKK